MASLMLYPVQKVVAVDIDGTLLKAMCLNVALVEWCRMKKANGYSLILWSSRGQNYARVIAERFNLTDLFDSIISKPGISVDDLGWDWTKYTITIHPDQIEQASFPIT